MVKETEAPDRLYHKEAEDESEQEEIDRRKQQLIKRQEAEGGPPRQPNKEIEEGRTVTQNKKVQNLVAMQRREEGLETNRSRSSSRRDRRKRLKKEQDEGKHMFTTSLEVLEEADARNELQAQRPFERIGPDSTSMDGPVTHARAMRGEIPIRGSDPKQPEYMPYKKFGEAPGGDSDGLKLSLEANLEIEIELKASIRGDLVLSLYT
ncbi:hypothetical protein B0A48_02460 [Cryoendolithus antarcticus]|uniref:Uncharacterized protein n=1 Tax=Cryoendolithus antarcticus TaxID=1507870 RepID=A0A1V8TNQ1_9PEZI|nr:hypothetical protein B0A48_02460 [Cryoendolithus antarcticus]